jgi:hypothetical protein
VPAWPVPQDRKLEGKGWKEGKGTKGMNLYLAPLEGEVDKVTDVLVMGL